MPLHCPTRRSSIDDIEASSDDFSDGDGDAFEGKRRSRRRRINSDDDDDDDDTDDEGMIRGRSGRAGSSRVVSWM